MLCLRLRHAIDPLSDVVTACRTTSGVYDFIWAQQLDGQKFKTLDEQNNALNKALGLAAQPETTGAKAA